MKLDMIIEVNWLEVIFLVIPGIVVLLLLENDIKEIKNISIWGSFTLLLMGILLWIEFDPLAVDYQYQIMFFQDTLFTYHLGIDGISLFLVLLTLFLLPICILASWTSVTFYIKEFHILFFIVTFLLLNVFCVLDLLIFYMFYESILIPMFLIIGIWGSRTRKIHAAYQFFLYTLFGSVIMLLAIIYLYITVGTLHISKLILYDFTELENKVIWLAFFASFAVKVPMIPVHIWLPEAHVEAPTAGSVLLAGILLKLGTYGLIRYSLPMFPFGTAYYAPLVYMLSIISIIYASLTTLRQIDLKKVIAYSSVVHMNYVTMGIVSENQIGIEGAIFFMISHGLVSSGLFLCVGFLYERGHSRVAFYYGGLSQLMPIWSILFFGLSLANISLPGTSSFIGEFLICMSLNEGSVISILLSMFGIFFGTSFSVLCFNKVLYGVGNMYETFIDINRRETVLIGSCLGLSIVLGIYPELILNYLHTSVIALTL